MAQTQSVMIIPIGFIYIIKLSFRFNLSSFINLNSRKKIKTYYNKEVAEVKKINLDIQISLLLQLKTVLAKHFN